ncbi:hypothetical protein ETD83_15730 [Actinomadura soli]|uniref:Uncharacterized protein n=1 Tax=Actinomadura soli TaxID=2508997 RepID=A0A5C4JDK4_9ACTN|nr:hypothetical protein [Actinomadura soli]TMR00838.1 hypothetical protein ETD83_15730 [Actinomadura soli]
MQDAARQRGIERFDRTVLTIRPGGARVGTTNGVNPIEVCLRSGFPAGAPEVGGPCQAVGINAGYTARITG